MPIIKGLKFVSDVFAAGGSELSLDFDQLSQVISRNIQTMTHNGLFNSVPLNIQSGPKMMWATLFCSLP